ncbi:MAG: hypothetical protein BAA04_04065 [Firmicutes bacterium ZCTH02-B6]|nr:MAG: hypothetical protein BAA04_04065 [Firmicutes bacterium ZCTH02-B6]
MPEHYFTERPRAEHRPLEIRENLFGRPFMFVTDAAVFSRRRLDPGTRLLIEHLPLPVTGNALDLGCGYGPVGIVIASLSPEARVWMVDINERAVELAKRNAAANRVANVEVRQGDGFTPVVGIAFSLIASNPPIRAGKRVVYAWVEQAYAHLEPGGRLVMVARTSQGARTLARHMEAVFGNVREIAKGSGYRVIQAVRVPATDAAAGAQGGSIAKPGTE